MSENYDGLQPKSEKKIAFMDAVKVCFSKYVDFTGRARRSEFWYFVLFNFIACVAIEIVGAILAAVFKSPVVVMILIGLWCLFMILPSIAVGIRRLHDIGKRGWWYLLGFIPLVCLVLLYFYCLPGEFGENEYGEDPKYEF
jgi:uncharacterized membrane protein YhaH (DUF805 family)